MLRLWEYSVLPWLIRLYLRQTKFPMATVQSIGSSMNNNFIAVVAGLLSHNLFFIHGEHHLRAPLYVQLGCLFSVGLFAARLNDGLQESITEVVATVGFYLLALFTSMVIYRVFFHSLRSFPGPPMYKITKLWHVMKVAPAQKNHLVLDELHRQYGDFVRTGNHKRDLRLHATDYMYRPQRTYSVLPWCFRSDWRCKNTLYQGALV